MAFIKFALLFIGIATTRGFMDAQRRLPSMSRQRETSRKSVQNTALLLLSRDTAILRQHQAAYEQDLWRQHRSSTRYLRAVLSSLNSGLTRGVASNIANAAAIAFVVASLDLMGFVKLRISPLPLLLISPALALLLIIRTNVAYVRWWEARTTWSAVKSRIRDLNRQGTSIPTWKQGGQRFAALAVAFAYSLKVHLRGLAKAKDEYADEHDALRANLTALVGRTMADTIMSKDHRPHAVTRQMTKLLGEADLSPQLQARVDQGISELVDRIGQCERLVANTPITLSRLSVRMVYAWVLFLPSALLGVGFGWWQVMFGSTLTAFLLFGIDRVGSQLQEPFSVLPLDDLCRELRGEYERMVVEGKQTVRKVGQIAGKPSYFPGYDHTAALSTQPPYLLA